MHTYIKQNITFNITTQTFKKLKISKSHQKHLKTVLYSIVFHQLFDFTLTLLRAENNKQFIITSLTSEPPINEMEIFLEANIKDHKNQYKKISKNAEKDFLKIVLNNLVNK